MYYLGSIIGSIGSIGLGVPGKNSLTGVGTTVSMIIGSTNDDGSYYVSHNYHFHLTPQQRYSQNILMLRPYKHRISPPFHPGQCFLSGYSQHNYMEKEGQIFPPSDQSHSTLQYTDRKTLRHNHIPLHRPQILSRCIYTAGLYFL